MHGEMRSAGRVWMLAVGVWFVSAAAADAPPATKTEKSLHKLGRGVMNVLTAPLELIRMPEQVGRRDGFLAGASSGLLQGAFRTVKRAVIGVFEVGTFYAEVPKDYAPLMQPEFVYANGNWQ